MQMVQILSRGLRLDFAAIANATAVSGTVMNDEYIVRMEAESGDEFWLAGDDADVEEEVDGLPVLRTKDMKALGELLA